MAHPRRIKRSPQRTLFDLHLFRVYDWQLQKERVCCELEGSKGLPGIVCYGESELEALAKVGAICNWS